MVGCLARDVTQTSVHSRPATETSTHAAQTAQTPIYTGFFRWMGRPGRPPCTHKLRKMPQNSSSQQCWLAPLHPVTMKPAGQYYI